MPWLNPNIRAKDAFYIRKAHYYTRVILKAIERLSEQGREIRR